MIANISTVKRVKPKALSNKAGVHSIAGVRHTGDFDDVKYQLALTLQTSLEVDTILSNFEQGLRAYDDQVTVRYSHEELALFYGSEARQRADMAYNLVLNSMKLGRVQIKRNRPFSNEEMAFLDECVSLLVHPLKNALLYHEAIVGSYTDPLTGLLNRRGLQNHLQREKSRVERYDDTFSILMIDVDKFKQVNDQYGHNCGDEVLIAIANVLNEQARDCDVVFRYAGDEFVVLAPKTDLVGGRQLAERIRQGVVSLSVQVNGETIRPSVSIGVAEVCKDCELSELFENADQALYMAKRSGRNKVA